MSKTTIKQQTGFELYLEGIFIPSFSSIQIREGEGLFPQAAISFPATSGIFRTLPGTIVQVFGPDLKESNKKILLFEGQVNSLNLSKTTGGKTVSLQCTSFLHTWQSATITPKDTLVTPEYRQAIQQTRIEYKNLTDESRDVEGKETNRSLQAVSNSLSNKFKSELFGDLPDLMDQIQFTGIGNFADEMNRLLRNESISKGDIHLLVNFFMRKFELQEPFFGLTSQSLRLSESVLSYPNFDKMSPFILEAILHNWQQFTSALSPGRNSNSLNLFIGLQQILQTAHYTLISPSNFTSSLQFWGSNSILSGDNTRETPARAYIVPNLENSPPANFNTIFPHEIENQSFNWNMLEEPTRTIGATTPIFGGGDFDIIGVNAFCTEPILNITNRGSRNNTAGLTPEETYRGITVHKKSFNWFFANTLHSTYGNTENTPEESKNEFLNDIKNPLNQLTIQEHYRKKLASRTLSLAATWSPYRMIGVPGTILSTENTPSFTGVLSSVTTVISGQGNVSSTLTFRGVRAIHEAENEAEHEDYEDMINDYTIDPYVNNNSYLFDPGIYDFKNIGKQLYTTLKWGTLTKESKIKEYATTGDTDSQIFKGSNKNINDLFSNRLYKQTDDSILSILRNSKGELESSLNFDLVTSAFSNSFGSSAELTKYIYDAVHTLRDTYKKIEENEQLLDVWAADYTYRKIISKGDYFAYLNIDPSQPLDRKVNYKDSIALLSGTENTLKYKETTQEPELTAFSGLTRAELITNQEQLTKERRLLSSAGLKTKAAEIGEKLKEIEKELNKKQAEEIPVNKEFENQIFKVYNLTRRAHVKVGFSSYIQNYQAGLQEHNPDAPHNVNITT